jgi:folate-binding protein YgfZ
VGPDSAKFLNGLITSRLLGSPKGTSDYDADENLYGLYTAFLNARGRLVADSFIYTAHHTRLLQDVTVEENTAQYIVEVDQGVYSMLVKALKIYKLRAKINIVPLDSEKFGVWALWDDTQRLGVLSMDEPMIFNPTAFSSVVGLNDNRAPGFGLRMVLPADSTPVDVASQTLLNLEGFRVASETDYRVRRYIHGIPEGSQELKSEVALPLDSCIDLMGGVDFDKGCYIGQELTIRSHHHGTVRKRVLPVEFSTQPFGDAPDEKSYDREPFRPSDTDAGASVVEDESLTDYTELYQPDSEVAALTATHSLVGANIQKTAPMVGDTEKLAKRLAIPSPFGESTGSFRKRDRPVGTVIGCQGNIGLAVIRLDEVNNSTSDFVVDVPDVDKKVYVQAYLPSYWPPDEEVQVNTTGAPN